MDVVECGANDNNVMDDGSVVSDTCWQETYRGASRKWLLSDGHRKHGEKVISTMKATYPYPAKEEEKQYLGERRANLLRKLYNEATEEIIRERKEPPPTEEYCTEYDGNYNSNIPIVKPKNEEQVQQELNEQYPLYSSAVTSYWSFKIDQNETRSSVLPGLTASADLKNPFKRNSGFTKPLSEAVDDTFL